MARQVIDVKTGMNLQEERLLVREQNRMESESLMSTADASASGLVV